MDDLQLVSTDALIKELQSRFDHSVFGGMRVKGNADAQANGDLEFIRRWDGNSHVCCGMCSDITYLVLDGLRDRETPIDPNT